MHCGNCMRKVEAALTSLPGVSAARVNLSDRRVAALFQPSVISTEQLMQAIERAGFKAAELKATSVIERRTRDQDLMRRLAVAGFAAMNIMLLSVSVWAGGDADMPSSVRTLFHWLSALIALPAVAYAGQPFFRSAANALKVRRLNMDVPISLGVILATTMSLYQTIRGSEQVYFDAAITLLAFLLLGRLLDEQMRRRASSAAANLLGLSATAASVIGDDGAVSRVALRKIVPGMRVLAAAGERIAVDGVVATGVSEVDQSLITGESLPKSVEPGDSVFAGTVNIGQPLTVTVS